MSDEYETGLCVVKYWLCMKFRMCIANKKNILAMLTLQILLGYLLISMHHSVISCFLCFQQKAKPCELTNTLPWVTQAKHYFLFQTNPDIIDAFLQVMYYCTLKNRWRDGAVTNSSLPDESDHSPWFFFLGNVNPVYCGALCPPPLTPCALFPFSQEQGLSGSWVRSPWERDPAPSLSSPCDATHWQKVHMKLIAKLRRAAHPLLCTRLCPDVMSCPGVPVLFWQVFPHSRHECKACRVESLVPPKRALLLLWVSISLQCLLDCFQKKLIREKG